MAGRRRTPEGRDNRVRESRRRLELTQAALADQVGVSRQTIVAIENGGYAPSVYLALGLAAALQESVESLFAAPVATPMTEREREV